MSTAIPMVDIPEKVSRILGSLRAGGRSLALQGVQLRARVVDRVAQVTVEETFHNPLTETIEAVYVFPLAGGCAVSGFEIRIGKRTVKARIEERGEARRQYQQALAEGQRAALLEQERDDVFTVQVGNLAPGDEIVARLTYSERLPFFEDGRTELRLPLVVAPRYVAGEELPREQAGHGVALGIEVEMFGGLSELECSQHAVRSSAGPESATVRLSREREPLDRDFVLRWRLAGETIRSQLLVHGEYAMLSLLPPARQGFLGVPRDVVFVLDRSGSMQGAKMASASRACALLLRTLAPRDRFAVQAFDDVTEWMPGGFLAADEGGIDRGEKWLRSVFSRGGTELDSAMREALAKIREAGGEGRVPVLVLLTDGQVGDESSVLKRIQSELGGARVFTVGIDTAVNGGFLRRLAALGGGTSTFVEPGARLEEALQTIGREIGTPLITDLKATGEISEGAPARLPDLFAGRAASAFFRYGGGRVRVTGRTADGKSWQEDLEPREAPLSAIDHLWARARIADLEDEFRASHSEQAKQQIVGLSLKHMVLTRFTAFVAIDDEVVNKGGARRTVVQPVAMPAEGEPAALLSMATATGRMVPMAAAPAGSPKAQLLTRAMGMLGGPLRGAMKMAARPPPLPPEETAPQRERVRKALEAFLEAFAEARKSREAGPLARARAELLEALAQALPIATAVPLLQAFLRGAAVELIGALQAGAADAALFDRQAAALQSARDEARAALANGKPPSGNFWEASI